MNEMKIMGGNGTEFKFEAPQFNGKFHFADDWFVYGQVLNTAFRWNIEGEAYILTSARGVQPKPEYNLTPVKPKCKFEEVKEWFKCNKEKGVVCKPEGSTKWFINPIPSFSGNGEYVQNDEYADFRMAQADGKIIQWNENHDKSYPYYVDISEPFSCYCPSILRVKPDITIKVNIDSEPLNKLAESMLRFTTRVKLAEDCEACGNYLDKSFENANCTGCSKNPFYMNCFTPKPELKVGDWVINSSANGEPFQLRNSHYHGVTRMNLTWFKNLEKWEPKIGEQICHKTLEGYYVVVPYKPYMKRFKGLAPKEFIQTLKDL